MTDTSTEPTGEAGEYTTDEREMSFLDHLEELRWHLIKAAGGAVVALVVCGFFADWIIDEVILRPGRMTNPPLDLINTIPYGQITFYMMVVISAALVLTVPWIIYQIWKFIQPGLLPRERKYISKIVFFSSLCFFAGVAFSYFVMLPYMLQFFAEFGTSDIRNMIAVSEYMSFVIQLVLISGLIFELPMVSYFLARFGILTPAFMRHYRRHSYVAILILAALVTPTTDPVTMMVFSLPIVALYELSIGIAAVAKRKRDAANPSIMDLS
jgi:sec-independent protein translocase protein TatC